MAASAGDPVIPADMLHMRVNDLESHIANLVLLGIIISGRQTSSLSGAVDGTAQNVC